MKGTILPEPKLREGMSLKRAIEKRETSREFCGKQVGAQTLSNILYVAYGISHGRHTIPTARNMENLLVFVVKADGAWAYDPRNNSLEKVPGSEAAADIFRTQPFMDKCGVSVVFAGSDKTYSAMHAGSAYQNIGLYCASEGMSCVVRGMFEREDARKILRLPEDCFVIISVAVGYSE